MNEFDKIIINKNRGWRGLAEAIVLNNDNDQQLSMVFSFSQAVWNDLICAHTIVVQDNDYYYVIRFTDNDSRLPKPEQQRSVLIKNFMGKVTEVNRYEKATWRSADSADWNYIVHFLKNRNNHTTSDWNCIGIRVTPEI